MHFDSRIQVNRDLPPTNDLSLGGNRVPHSIVRWGVPLPAEIEGTRRLLGAVARRAVTVLALALLVRGRLGVDSTPTWVKP